MALSRRDVILASIAAFFAWGYAIHWFPILRWAGHAFIAGSLVTVLLLLLITALTSAGAKYTQRHSLRRPRGALFLSPATWQKDVKALQKRHAYESQALYPDSFIVSTAIDDLLRLILRDFVNSWYSNISKNSVFPNEVDKSIRAALVSLRDRLLVIDITEVVTTRVVPILTAHFKDFYEAEKGVRGKYLNRNVTESEELDLAIASRYNNGKLHGAASLAYSDTKLVQQEYLRKLVEDLLPSLLPENVLGSRAVSVIVRELVACAVLSPVIQMLSDPDLWNQIMEGYGRTMLQDRSTVRKLRAALDEHASPSPKSKKPAPFPRLSPGDHERKFEKFIRAIRKTNNLSDARRFRSEVASQLRRDSLRPDQDPTYLRRLDIGKKVLDQRVNQLASGGEMQAHQASLSNGTSVLENASLPELLHDPSGLSFFMEYMDRQKLMSLVQFWIVVDGFRTPLEDDGPENDAIPTNLPSWTDADKADIAQITEAYLQKPDFKISETAIQSIKKFLAAGSSASSTQYFLARRAILRAQTATLDFMQERHFEPFKRSELFYKCIVSHEATKTKVTPPSPIPPSVLDTAHKPYMPPRASSAQLLKPTPISRLSSKLVPKRTDLKRAAVSSTDLLGARLRGQEFGDNTRRSLDEVNGSPLFDNDDEIDSDYMQSSIQSLDGQNGIESNELDDNVVETMEAVLTNIMEDKSDVNDLRQSLFGDDLLESPSASVGSLLHDSPRASVDHQRADLFGDRLSEKSERPNIASLGLVNTSSRIGVFTDDDLFPDEEKFISDEHDDPEDEKRPEEDEDVHEAAPGDLGLAEAVTALSTDIDRLIAQDAVVDSLTRKAELTNNVAELRILKKSKASLQREIRRKELQRQQYIIQESDNSLYGRSTIRIRSIMVDKEDDGREFAIYVVEVQRKAGEQMPAATWTITRRYSEFHDLHQRLRVRYPSVRNLDFPRRRMVMTFQPQFLQKRRTALENYMRAILLLPEVCRSRDLRAFLSQSAIGPGDENGQEHDDRKDLITRLYNSVTDGVDDILGNIPVLDQLSVAGQNLISAATSQLITMPSNIGEDANSAAEAEAELNAFEDKELEPFVKPICDIFLEVFELNRGNNWLRGRAVVVVLHQLLGGTIEKKVRDNVKSLISEEALIKYINMLKSAMWPNGQLKKDSKPRSASERLKTRTEASLMLATLIPDLAASVVGRVNAQAASRRIFATFNNPRLNSHLVFTILDEMIEVLFPDVVRT